MIPEVKIPSSPKKTLTPTNQCFTTELQETLSCDGQVTWFRQTAESIFVHAEMHAVKNMAKSFQNHLLSQADFALTNLNKSVQDNNCSYN